MQNIKISPLAYNSGDMHVYIAEIESGENTIWVGRNLEMVAHTFNTDLNMLPINMFKNREDYYETDCEKMISHESLHIILHRIQGYETSYALDNIDRPPHSFMIVGNKQI